MMRYASPIHRALATLALCSAFSMVAHAGDDASKKPATAQTSKKRCLNFLKDPQQGSLCQTVTWQAFEEFSRDCAPKKLCGHPDALAACAQKAQQLQDHLVDYRQCLSVAQGAVLKK